MVVLLIFSAESMVADQILINTTIVEKSHNQLIREIIQVKMIAAVGDLYVPNLSIMLSEKELKFRRTWCVNAYIMVQGSQKIKTQLKISYMYVSFPQQI